jgi:hypothetical protein
VQAGRAGERMRAAYHGHVLELAEQLVDAERAAHAAGDHSVVSAIQLAAGWAAWVESEVEPRLANEKRDAWEAPMPATDLEGLVADDFPTTMDLQEYSATVSDEFGNTYEVRRTPGRGLVAWLLSIAC